MLDLRHILRKKCNDLTGKLLNQSAILVTALKKHGVPDSVIEEATREAELTA